MSYGWPGNVRELRNMLEQNVLLTPSKEIGAHQLTLCLTLDGDPAVMDFLEEQQTELPAVVHASDDMTLSEVTNENPPQAPWLPSG